MKSLFIIITFFLTYSAFGQETYFSPLTENLKTGEKEIINRTITIQQSAIIIKTDTDNGYDIQTLKILEKEIENDTNPSTAIYDCTSPDGVYPTTILIPQKSIISEILVIQPSLVSDTDEHFRFHIEQKENLFQ